MKQLPKLIFILFLLLFVITAFSQTSGHDPASDDGFNIFLLSLLVIFVCTMFGAAIIGAMAATLLLFFMFALIAIGVLSTSVAIGLYRRSFAAGFRSFLKIVLGTSCGVIGGAALLIVDHAFDLPLSATANFWIGMTGGFTGGLILAIAACQSFQWMIKYAAAKLKMI